MDKDINQNTILFHITESQVESLCKHFNKDITTLQEYEVCELLDKLIDELSK